MVCKISMYSTVHKLFQHMSWADSQILTAILSAKENISEAQNLFGHIIAAEHIWLSRIYSTDIGDFTPWKKLTLQECKDLAEKNSRKYFALSEKITDSELERLVTYKTTKGDEYHSKLGDILVHVALHGSYHRGQIASLLKANQMPVPATDFILFSRNQLPF